MIHLRTMLLAIALAALAFGTSGALANAEVLDPEGPGCAAAIYPPPTGCGSARLANVLYTGWTWLDAPMVANCTEFSCSNSYRAALPAWRWTGTRWAPSELTGGWVYVAPYTGRWRWAWTKSTGWVAVTGGSFELRSW